MQNYLTSLAIIATFFTYANTSFAFDIISPIRAKAICVEVGNLNYQLQSTKKDAPVVVELEKSKAKCHEQAETYKLQEELNEYCSLYIEKGRTGIGSTSGWSPEGLKEITECRDRINNKVADPKDIAACNVHKEKIRSHNGFVPFEKCIQEAIAYAEITKKTSKKNACGVPSGGKVICGETTYYAQPTGHQTKGEDQILGGVRKAKALSDDVLGVQQNSEGTSKK